MNFDESKPVYIKEQIYDPKTGNIYPPGDRPYNLKAIPEKCRTPEYLTQETVTVEKVQRGEQTVDIRPYSGETEPIKTLKADSVVIKESELPPPPQVNIQTESVTISQPEPPSEEATTGESGSKESTSKKK